MKMNQHYNELKASYLFVDINHRVAAFQKAHPDREVIRLGIGDVTRPLAGSVVKAMQDAVAEMGTAAGFHGYGPEQGYDFLREAVQGYYAGHGVQPSSVVIVNWVVMVPSAALDSGTYSSTLVRLITTPAACMEVWRGRPSRRFDISIRYLTSSSFS